MLKFSSNLIVKACVLSSLSILSACGGGGSSDGPDVMPTNIPAGAIPSGNRIGAEFVATQCIDSTVGIGGSTIVNSCDQNVNVRGLSGGAFGRVVLVAANSTIVVSDIAALLTVCFAPRVPGGIAEFLTFQCLE